LSKRDALPGVDFVDGGVAGGALLNLIEDQIRWSSSTRWRPPSPARCWLFPDDLKRSGKSVPLHDLNLTDTLDLMRLRGTLPDMVILGVVPADIETYRIGLSDPLAARFEEILAKIRIEIEKFAGVPG
jgi:hydrogenase maturation protease